MAQLDKTFPTNDCSACILAPKVTSCYNHPLVKTYTWSELVEIRGEAPDFTAVIRKKARYIDEDLCKGCGACTLKCPVSAKSEFDMGLDERRAVFKPYAQAVPNIVTIEKKGTSPCKYNCPAHLDANGYVALLGQGRFDEALQLIRRTTPFAGVLGRVCDRKCESHCYRQHVDSPVNIAALERFVSDYEVVQGKTPKFKKEKPRSKKVAVIGSGPAGLNCAYNLAIKGYEVTVFEAKDAPGGALRYGIPEFRLDRKVLDREIQIIEELGVEIRPNTCIGRDLTLDDLKEQGYSAFFFAVGAQKDKKFGIPGEDLPGVITVRKFLEEFNRGKPVSVGKRVVILGNARGAVDAARTALRLGSEATIVFSGSESELEAAGDEINRAREEGVRFIAEAGDFSINRKDSALLLDYTVSIHGSEYAIEADTIITAAGGAVDIELLNQILGGSPGDEKGNITLDKETLASGIPGAFIGVDPLLQADGSKSAIGIVDAVAIGNRAARSIYNYLEGEDVPLSPFLLPETPIEKVDFKQEINRIATRASMPGSAVESRGFDGEDTGITSAEEAKEEALRCMNCSVCAECRACERVCPPKAIRHEQQDEIIEVEVSSVIMAPGFDTSTDIPDVYGYGKYPDVVTSLEYERILSASGPFKGHVQRPSDGKTPSRIAFLQCVGSRDEKCSSSYCSAVCCMYAVKEAVITKEHLPSVKDIDIFYMDIRAYGKDFDKYVDSALSKHGIGFVKSRVAEIVENKDNGRLVVWYSDENGNMASQEYDMVVLSVGLKPKDEVKGLLEKTGVKTERHGFSWVNEMSAPNTSRNGILACGASAGPKDIPETVVEAGAAAAEATEQDSLLALQQNSVGRTNGKQYHRLGQRTGAAR
jgi:heterodisulfide reductase subunit A-like polyferredoxin